MPVFWQSLLPTPNAPIRYLAIQLASEGAITRCGNRPALWRTYYLPTDLRSFLPPFSPIREHPIPGMVDIIEYYRVATISRSHAYSPRQRIGPSHSIARLPTEARV